MENELMRVRPAMFRNRPISFILSCVLILAFGLGLIILFFWYMATLATTLIITDKRTILQRGLFSKHTNEVMHEHIRNIDIRQNFVERMLSVGRIGISSAGQGDVEIDVRGIPDPYEIKDLIDKYRLA